MISIFALTLSVLIESWSSFYLIFDELFNFGLSLFHIDVVTVDFDLGVVLTVGYLFSDGYSSF
jgi:hypothetical protein